VTAANPTAILFDFDGVIVDSEALHHRAYERALAPYGVDSIPLEIYADSFSNRGVGLEYCAQRVPGLDVIALKRRKDVLFRRILESEARLVPGVGEVLAALAAERSLAVATGSERAAAAFVLEQFGLREYFRAIIAREDYARDKPAPDAFLRACEAIGTDPSSCLVVEDSYKGLCAARAAGIPCVVVPNDYTRGGDFSAAAAILGSIHELSSERAEEIHRRYRAT
jgi:beta-phosphoglucomutase